MVNINSIEEKKNKILSINNFSNVHENIENIDIDENVITNASISSAVNLEDSNENLLSVDSNENLLSVNDSLEENSKSSINNDSDGDEGDEHVVSEGDKEVMTENNLNELHLENDENRLLQGGTDIVYNIDYLLDDDEKLVDSEKIINQVDIYISNYNSPKMQKYKKNVKDLYQKYSNKNYIITTIMEKQNITKIIVKKNDKTNKIVMELVKPTYYIYNDNNNLLKLKKNISNARIELLYKYEKLVAKLNILPEEKKIFEKERQNFIVQLEDYYIYVLYHNKINKIITINKSSLVLQKEMFIFKEQNDYESKILNSNIYSVDNSFIDTMNKYNSDSLIQFNNIIQTLSGKKVEDIKKDKKLTETIKTYISNINKKELFYQSLLKNTDEQDNYINYIILQLP